MKKRNIIKHKNLFSYIKIEKEILAFGYIEIEKKSVFLRDTDIENVLLSNNISFGEKKNYKYFIGYLHDDHKVMPLKCNASYTKRLCKKLMDKLNGYIFSLKMMTY